MVLPSPRFDAGVVTLKSFPPQPIKGCFSFVTVSPRRVETDLRDDGNYGWKLPEKEVG